MAQNTTDLPVPQIVAFGVVALVFVVVRRVVMRRPIHRAKTNMREVMSPAERAVQQFLGNGQSHRHGGGDAAVDAAYVALGARGSRRHSRRRAH